METLGEQSPLLILNSYRQATYVICRLFSIQSDVLHFLCEQSVNKAVVQIAHINFMQVMTNFT